ncbi:hypothetical protein Godav_021897 [Gossypium davidsonii]|uniref:Uncharacterized protein n=1 Tax=Gossypium davidsonii TaxID=34287 RepID=A0A7J8TC35_GOSDV|nr:hypothetical protein [Gossypium davidsonii]
MYSPEPNSVLEDKAIPYMVRESAIGKGRQSS